MTELPIELRRSSRDPDVLRTRLQDWFRTRHPNGEIGALSSTSATGMSSDTLLFSASWTDESGSYDGVPLVARLAPSNEDVPVFPSYDLTRQFDLIRAVEAQTDVPVPPTLWNEPDPAVLGTRFFVMRRVDGQVPPDLLPYNFGDSWLYSAAPQDQRRLQDSTIDVLGRLHTMPAPEWLEFDEPGETALRRHVAHTRAWYDFVAGEGVGSKLVEDGFAWLDANWPASESEAVVNWGDARVGNVLYQDFAPAAVLDWEMAGVGPRELDLAWCIYAHRGFDDIAHALGLPGMPDFMRRDDAVECYATATGYEPRDLDWYETYSAVQFAIVYVRIGWRSVHFGELDLPADPDELIHNREPLQQMIEGKYF